MPKQELLELTLLKIRQQNINPDVICLSETFLRANQGNYLNINNYVYMYMSWSQAFVFMHEEEELVY